MTLLQLRYFIAVCKHQSLTKAARELSVSQPGISLAMKELEAECGFSLFERRPNSIRVTNQGHSFLREAEQMMHAYEQMQSNAARIAEEKSVLRVGVAAMGAGMAFPRLRKGFYRSHPDVVFEVTENSTEHLYHKIDAGELDFALCVSISLPDEHYQYVTVGQSRLMFCVHRDNPMAKRKISRLAQLGDTPLVMLADRYSQTKYLKRLFDRAGCQPNVIQYTSQVFTILQNIRENAAGGFLSEDIAGLEPNLVAFPLYEVDLASVTMIWRKDRMAFAASDAFIQYLKRQAKQL